MLLLIKRVDKPWWRIAVLLELKVAAVCPFVRFHVVMVVWMVSTKVVDVEISQSYVLRAKPLCNNKWAVDLLQLVVAVVIFYYISLQ